MKEKSTADASPRQETPSESHPQVTLQYKRRPVQETFKNWCLNLQLDPFMSDDSVKLKRPQPVLHYSKNLPKLYSSTQETSIISDSLQQMPSIAAASIR